MKAERKIVFVGQGPNQAAWEHGLALGDRLCSKDPARIAESYCERIALTGACGEKLAKLLEVDRRDFLRAYPRRNLNARFNGKKGKGDGFDRDEGRARARDVIAEGFTDFVLLGREVARAFDCGFEPLEVREFKATGRRFFLLPHPSGINLWWNEAFNVFRARKRLREFLGVEEEPKNP